MAFNDYIFFKELNMYFTLPLFYLHLHRFIFTNEKRLISSSKVFLLRVLGMTALKTLQNQTNRNKCLSKDGKPFTFR